MTFKGLGRPFGDDGMARSSQALGVTAAEIWAVLTVETRGFGMLPDRRPMILFERHIFHRLTGGKFDAVNSNISSPHAGGYAGGAAEYQRLEAAMQLDRDAALKSASWGIGQVMGMNHQAAGFATVGEFVTAMVRNEESQLLAMGNFIRNGGLAPALQRQDWVAFARGYNGKDFKRNDYDSRLAAAHARWKTALPDLELRTAQAALTYLGFNPGPIDGLRGRLTRSALVEFQMQQNLAVTGDLDDRTEERLLAVAFPAAEVAGA
ncbi:MAG: N-acetylmuramidase domain-containing protein [Bryobacteraceae bacterium]|nr:N-acetylmuramidase domain-containing protein [Bryobacteraceae bacterium]